ncbi:hypothetical protein UFOVP49_178 [uncultured Caudovirales phage]|uniref:Deoxynucleoside monophosphate kinase n=1 Tax=uncultured Caudovirales phage TaxID=2100421 RepID=A0A6J5KVT8_9CAUD|nr:hypothetical protein UFOVP49_178 [uncultured Caudovirales phage]
MIIGLVGFIGEGKGTIADTLVEHHGFIKESFASGVKDATSAVFGWDRALLEGDTDESRAFREQPDTFWSDKFGKEFTPRLALQLMGTEAGRDVFDKNIWIYSLIKRTQNNPDKNYVIADVRFPNEIDAIRELGGKVIRIKRRPNPEWYELAFNTNTKKDYYGMAAAYPDVHYSEWAWIGSDIDIIMDNSCEFDQVRANVNRLIEWTMHTHVEDYDPSEVLSV